MRLTQGQVLVESGRAARFVYFPTTAIVSLAFVARGAPPTEIGMVGNEGLVGFSSLVDDPGGAAGSAVVQRAGWGFRLPLQTLQGDLEQRALLHLLLRHAQALVAQMAQTAACIRHHAILEQVCRWLLLCLDRADGDDLPTTHARIAATLGVRRASVSDCARRLQAEGLIRCTRGLVSVVDRAALETRACGCYGVITREYQRLLATPRAAGPAA